MKEKPLVSVVIPTYNREKYLSRAVQSCLDQSYPRIEVIIVDDGSKDDTQRVVAGLRREFPNKKIVYIKEKHQGACAARNTGIELAKGDFIQFLDSDDWIAPVKIKAQVESLLNTGNSVSVCDFVFVDEKGGEVLKVRNDGDLQKKLANFGSIFISSALFRTETLKGKIWWNRKVERNQDVDFMLRYFSMIRSWSYTQGVWSYYAKIHEERISDTYVLGSQFMILFESFSQFWREVGVKCAPANKWMLQDFGLYVAGEFFRKREIKKCTYVMLKTMILCPGKKVFMNFFYFIKKSLTRFF